MLAPYFTDIPLIPPNLLFYEQFLTVLIVGFIFDFLCLLVIVRLWFVCCPGVLYNSGTLIPLLVVEAYFRKDSDPMQSCVKLYLFLSLISLFAHVVVSWQNENPLPYIPHFRFLRDTVCCVHKRPMIFSDTKFPLLIRHYIHRKLTDHSQFTFMSWYYSLTIIYTCCNFRRKRSSKAHFEKFG